MIGMYFKAQNDDLTCSFRSVPLEKPVTFKKHETYIMEFAFPAIDTQIAGETRTFWYTSRFPVISDSNPWSTRTSQDVFYRVPRGQMFAENITTVNANDPNLDNFPRQTDQLAPLIYTCWDKSIISSSMCFRKCYYVRKHLQQKAVFQTLLKFVPHFVSYCDIQKGHVSKETIATSQNFQPIKIYHRTIVAQLLIKQCGASIQVSKTHSSIMKELQQIQT